jgi:hypothetical protein
MTAIWSGTGGHDMKKWFKRILAAVIEARKEAAKQRTHAYF